MMILDITLKPRDADVYKAIKESGNGTRLVRDVIRGNPLPDAGSGEVKDVKAFKGCRFRLKFDKNRDADVIKWLGNIKNGSRSHVIKLLIRHYISLANGYPDVTHLQSKPEKREKINTAPPAIPPREMPEVRDTVSRTGSTDRQGDKQAKPQKPLQSQRLERAEEPDSQATAAEKQDGGTQERGTAEQKQSTAKPFNPLDFI